MAQNGNSGSKNIIILGGSYGGISVAHCTLKHTIPVLPQKEDYKIILVSTASEAICRPACPRALVSDDFFPQDKLFVGIPKQFEQYPVRHFEFIHGSATAVDNKKRTVTIATHVNDQTQVINFHVLVIATGASTPSPLFGFGSNDEKTLRKAWTNFRTGLETAKNIVIAGGGPVGVETAGELGEHLNGRAGFLGSSLQNPRVPITVVTSGPHILPNLRPSIAKTAEEYLAKVGVTVTKGKRVMSVDPPNAGSHIDKINTKATLKLDDGSTLEVDLFIPATGYRPNTGFLSKDILDASTSQVATNPFSLRVDKAGPRIYAIGDASNYARPAVHSIMAAVPILGANIKRDLLLAAGKAESEVGAEQLFKEEKRETQMVPIGKSKGVGAAMGWRLPSWAVWLIKGRDYWLWTRLLKMPYPAANRAITNQSETLFNGIQYHLRDRQRDAT
ncbi:FAD/NAD(P)-binding domain-containing protein [Bimuria novae-zelandiae CBS 107.79]|uniref:FAD/NAD(P)-binding domain-containing protein n=1 Tax=Bimuria novae-zelandiae CBS 107.79 TaxID=1447943 RepID=A0A6A5UPF2_9PLEO|nr:FAD/NAD(P)-binding domain-containing protein [Bimuria novae-zelandiae CBS 107.79]